MEIDDNDFKKLLGLLQKLVEDKVSTPPTQQPQNKNQEKETESYTEDTEDDEQEIPQHNIKTRSKSNRSKSGGKKKKFVNKFLSMKEAGMHKADSAIDKKLNKYPPTQRNRPYEPAVVTCRVCGKKEEVHPSLIESRDRYKCNKCSTGQG